MPASASATGVVQGVERVDQKEAGIGVGTIAGAVVGGLVGNQVGSGTGRTAATVAGAAGGAMGGRAMEDRMQQSSGSSGDSSSGEAYRVTLRMDDGSQQVFATDVDPQFRVGQRVQVVNGIVMHY
jgi:outer membrane lipoprotein SlyB